MGMKPLTEQQMTAIAFENIRHFGNVDNEMVRDTGIATIDDMPAVVADALKNQETWANATEEEKKAAVAPFAGAFTCGDCLTEVQPGQSCGHMRIDAKGNRSILG